MDSPDAAGRLTHFRPRRPTLIVADEPTGDLDRESAGDILHLLQRLNDELGKPSGFFISLMFQSRFWMARGWRSYPIKKYTSFFPYWNVSLLYVRLLLNIVKLKKNCFRSTSRTIRSMSINQITIYWLDHE